MKIEIFQIAYNEETLHSIQDKDAIVFYNQASDKYLENSIIARTGDFVNNKSDYFGILSARFEEKMRWKQSKGKTIGGAKLAIEEDNYQHDVYSFFGSDTKRNIWAKAEQWQPGILEIAELLFKQYSIDAGQPIGDLLQLETPVVYQNAFIAKNSVYSDYVNNWLRPLMHIMETNEQISKLLFEDAQYRDAKLTPEECWKVFGRPYYTYHAFVCERFFSTYLAINSHLTIKHI